MAVCRNSGVPNAVFCTEFSSWTGFPRSVCDCRDDIFSAVRQAFALTDSTVYYATVVSHSTAVYTALL